MKREDAYYFKILLMSGLDDGYDAWLDSCLEEETHLSDIVLNLSFCRSDINKTISHLHNFCAEQDFDKNVVCEKLRLFLKNAYHSSQLSKDKTISYMHRFAVNHGEFHSELWGSMFYMDDYYYLASDGTISWKRFDYVFDAYITDGTPVDSNKFWNYKQKPNESLFKRFLSLFFRK